MERKSYSTHQEPIPFDIDGEEFVAQKMPGALFVDFTRRAQTATEEEMAQLLYDGFSACMDEPEFERFWKRCRTDVPIDVMSQIFNDLAARSASRPTEPSSPSAPGRRRAQAAAGSSARVSKLRDSTSENSAT